MNNNTIPEPILHCERNLNQPVDELRSSASPIWSANTTEKQLIWSSHKPGEWEILVYKQTEFWEACFFRWPLHHEHATGSSFDSVKQRAEQRIRTLEAGRLRQTRWEGTIH